jgi:hypothetical protein
MEKTGVFRGKSERWRSETLIQQRELVSYLSLKRSFWTNRGWQQKHPMKKYRSGKAMEEI